MDHRKLGQVVEPAVAMVRSVYFVMGFGHEVGKHCGDLGGSEVVILLLHLLRKYVQCSPIIRSTRIRFCATLSNCANKKYVRLIVQPAYLLNFRWTKLRND